MTAAIDKLIAEILALPAEERRRLVQMLPAAEFFWVREAAVRYDNGDPQGLSGMKSVLVTLPDDLANEAEAAGLLEDESVEELLRRALRDRVVASDSSHPSGAKSVRLPVYKGTSGLARGIDPSSNRSMLDAVGEDVDDA